MPTDEVLCLADSLGLSDAPVGEVGQGARRKALLDAIGMLDRILTI